MIYGPLHYYGPGLLTPCLQTGPPMARRLTGYTAAVRQTWALCQLSR
jgi:hypothetical protein